MVVAVTVAIAIIVVVVAVIIAVIIAFRSYIIVYCIILPYDTSHYIVLRVITCHFL